MPVQQSTPWIAATLCCQIELLTKIWAEKTLPWLTTPKISSIVHSTPYSFSALNRLGNFDHKGFCRVSTMTQFYGSH